MLLLALGFTIMEAIVVMTGAGTLVCSKGKREERKRNCVMSSIVSLKT